MSDSLQPHGLQHISLPLHHQLPELTQTHVHWIRDAIPPSHPLLSPSPPIFNLSSFFFSFLFLLLSKWYKIKKKKHLITGRMCTYQLDNELLTFTCEQLVWSPSIRKIELINAVSTYCYIAQMACSGRLSSLSNLGPKSQKLREQQSKLFSWKCPTSQ